MTTPRRPGDPWRGAPVGELQDQVLPRWFVITAAVTLVAAVVTLAAAFIAIEGRDLPVAARRPPPGHGLTNDVGEVRIGGREPVPYEDACSLLEGIRIAGSQLDRAVLRRGLAALCNIELEEDTRERLRSFAEAGGVVRFATFERTGVASTARMDRPVVYVNARHVRTNPLWITPLVVHDVTLRTLEPASAEAALEARLTEARACDRVLGDQPRSAACRDAAAVVALPDPVDALREAGYR